MTKVSIIAAIGKNRELGKDNQLLWDIPEDMQFFRETTKGHPVIMGRKTYESIGRPLPNRTNIIITRNKKYQQDNCISTTSIEEAIQIAKKHDNQEIFIIGGAMIYEQSLELADYLHLTLVNHNFDADTFFPSFQETFQQISSKESKDKNYNYIFTKWSKI